MQPPSQPCQVFPDDSRYGFHPPSPPPPVPLQPRDSRSPSHPSNAPSPLQYSQSLQYSQTPQQSAPLNPPETGDSEDEEEVPGLEPEIDEQSDDEDDRQAHAFLSATPNQVPVVAVSQSPPTVRGVTATAPQPPPTGQDHFGFAVSMAIPA